MSILAPPPPPIDALPVRPAPPPAPPAAPSLPEPSPPPRGWRRLVGRHDQAELRRYWDTTARSFRPFTGAPSTQMYYRQEQRIFTECFAPMAGKSLLKLDLWNEVHNTQILRWAARQGAIVHAIDIADYTVQTARRNFLDEGLDPRFAIADVRQIPFRENSFDYIYTMGTIEHFENWEHAVGEVFRVLKPGGTAVIGVPNKRDPFFRPFVVAMLEAFLHYPYGYEQSFSHAELAAACRRQGFDVIGRDGLLFVPALLRMADLWFYIRTHALAPLFRAACWPFETACERFPQLNQHGYLIAAVVRKP